MRKYYWYISTFFRKHGVLLLASIVVAIIVFSLAFPLVLKLFDFKKKSYIGVVGRYTLTTLPRDIQDEISLGLTKLSQDGTPLPSLAERWLIADDGKTYHFLIKKNLHWQDGKDLVPEDINYNLNKLQIIKNANEVVFKLPDPFAPFPTVVSQPIFRVVTERYFLFFKKQKIIGLGKYQVSDYKERNTAITELTLISNTDEKVYRFYLTEQDAINGFKRGEVDILRDFSSPGDLEDWPTTTTTTFLDKKSLLGVFFNVKDTLFSSKEVRQALNYALQKPTDETRALGPISPESWAFSNVGKTYDYDEGRAIDRLLSNPPGAPIHFSLTTTPTFSLEAEQMKKQWESFGQKAAAACQKSSLIKEKSLCENFRIQVDLRINNFPDTSNFEALLVGEELPIDPDQYALWHSSQQTNFTNYTNVRIDSLLEKGRQVQDQKQRAVIYQDFQQFFSDDAPVIFLRYLNKFEIHRKGK
jgi:peptide/nickel transport system substrate-binding protein